MKILIRIFFGGIIFFAFSCRQLVKRQNTIPTDKCILIEYSDSKDCKVLEFYNSKPTKVDSFCGEIPVDIDDFSKYYPSKKVFYVYGLLKPKALTVLLFWDNDYKEEVSSFPFNYSLITIDSLQNDSIIWFQFNGKDHYLSTNSTYTDSVISIKKEENKKVKYTTTINIKNLGFIMKKNIYDNDNWGKKRKEFNSSIPGIVDVMPEFKGGYKDLFKYLKEKIIYPEKAKNKRISGKVYVEFYVDTVGNINHVSVLRGIDPLLDSIALNAIESMPKWIPGKNNGKDTTVRMVIPIKFSLN